MDPIAEAAIDNKEMRGYPTENSGFHLFGGGTLGDLSKWILGALLAITTMFGGWVYAGVNSRIDLIEARVNDHSERIRANEIRYESIILRLESIDKKLDKLVESR